MFIVELQGGEIRQSFRVKNDDLAVDNDFMAQLGANFLFVFACFLPVPYRQDIKSHATVTIREYILVNQLFMIIPEFFFYFAANRR